MLLTKAQFHPRRFLARRRPRRLELRKRKRSPTHIERHPGKIPIPPMSVNHKNYSSRPIYNRIIHPLIPDLPALSLPNVAHIPREIQTIRGFMIYSVQRLSAPINQHINQLVNLFSGKIVAPLYTKLSTPSCAKKLGA